MKRIFTFGPFELSEGERLLRRAGSPVPLPPKAFDALLLLVENSGKLVDRGQLLASVWKDVHVEEAVVTRVISDLRRSLRQTEQEVWIETVPKFGYRFAASVRVEGNAPEAAPPARRPKLLWAVVPAALAAVAILALASFRRGSGEVLQIAVLPFQVVGGAADSEVLGLGMADSLITRLSSIQNLIVRPVSVVRRFAGQAIDSRKAGGELAVDAVVEGTLQLVEGRARANVRLVRASDGKAWWAGTVSSGRGGLLSIEDSLVQQIAENLAVRISPEERRNLRASGLNPAAHELYVRGRYEWGKRTRKGFEAAADYFRQAIDLDPAYARAHAGLADCYLLLGAYSFYPQLEMLPKAKAIALRALELDPSLAEAHATLGLITQNLDWDWAAVERHYRRAIELDPNYATAHHWYAEFLSILGRFEESRREFALARRVDPISPIIQVDEAQLYFFQRDYGRTLEMLNRVAQLEPEFDLVHERMAWVYMMQGREDDAWREVEKMASCGPDSDCRKTWTAWLPRRGRPAAVAALRELEARAKTRHVPPSALVVAYERQGDAGRALNWLEYMADRHEVWLITAKVNPLFDSLRSTPRFQAILRRLAL